MSIIEKIKQFFKKFRKGLAIGGTVATVGLTAGCNTDKDVKAVDNNAKIEQEANGIESQGKIKQDSWKDSIVVDSNELLTIENEIAQLENSDDVLNYLKDIYVEGLDLNAEDIEIVENNQNYVYILGDGTIVTHGIEPLETERVLDADGKSYLNSDEGLEVYSVKLNENKETIDSITVGKDEQGKECAIKVIPGDKYEEMKEYTSTLENLNMIIPEGFDYMEQLDIIEQEGKTEFTEKQCENAKNNFINAIKETKNKSNSKQEVAQSNDDIELENN